MSKYMTHSEIIDAIRLKCARAYWSEDSLHPNGDIPEIKCLEPHKLATQLESAHRREVDDLKKQIALLSKTHENDNSATANVTGIEHGNVAKLREACVYALAELEHFRKCNDARLHFADIVHVGNAKHALKTALAAPPRNCDKYPTFNDAIRALADKRGWHDAKWNSERYCILARWLYAPATEKEGGDK